MAPNCLFEGNRDSGEFRLYQRKTSEMETHTEISAVKRQDWEVKCFRGWKVELKINFDLKGNYSLLEIRLLLG